MTNPMDKTRRRPKMQNYGISEASAGMLSWEWVDEQCARARNYWVCSTRPNGNPHAAPVWGVWHEGALYFGSDPQSRKARNFAHNPHIVVHLESGDDTVILEGKVSEERDPARIAPVDRLYAAKYPPFDPAPSAFYLVFRPSTALAWRESDFPTSATRWELD